MPLVIIAHNIRSTYNIGAILRTADGFGVERVFVTGYTPYPAQPYDTRLPHIIRTQTAQIHKTALGAELTLHIEHYEDAQQAIRTLLKEKYEILALEQALGSIPLPSVTIPQKIALLLGEEVHGIAPDLLALCTTIVEIPMFGHKESFNVSVAAGIALYELSGRRT